MMIVLLYCNINNKQKMKARSQFRIIYLKNDDPGRGRLQSSRKYNVLSAGKAQNYNEGDSLTPNIVHLSARLQDDALHMQIVDNDESKGRKQGGETNSGDGVVVGQNGQTSNRQKIDKYMQMRRQCLNKEKNTIRNLLGAINWQNSKRKEKRISCRIRQNMKSISASSKLMNTQQRQQCENNRLQLQQDFNNFIINKDKERRKKEPNPEQLEQNKLIKLSIIQPEQQQCKVMSGPVNNLNLYRFIGRGGSGVGRKGVGLKNRSSSGAIVSRIEKKMFNLNPSLRTEEQQFKWSRIYSRDVNYKFKSMIHHT